MFQSFKNSSERNHTPRRIEFLRALIKNYKLDGVIIPKADRYQGEYIPPEDERLTWISGFTGSAGTALVFAESAVLFVDGRYSLQAKIEVNSRIFKVEDSTKTSIVNWLKINFKYEPKIAFDPWLTTVSQVKTFLKEAEGKIKFLPRMNLVDKLWERKSGESSEKIFHLSNEISGESVSSKLNKILAILKVNDIKNYIFCKPDAICWLLNIRGKDVAHNPVVNCFSILRDSGEIIIFSENLDKFSELKNKPLYRKIHFKKFSELRNFIINSKGSTGFDQNYLPWKIYQYLESSNKKIIQMSDPANTLKLVKNNTEVNGMISAHLRDAVAFIKFMYWFFKLDKTSELDEISLIKKLESYRRNTGFLREISFDTICGSGPNGAIIHYRATNESNRKINKDDIILIDSGGQYLDGTTDITRSICRGACDTKTKRLYTLVLKGLIALSSQRWPRGLTGRDLDPLARQFLWNSLNDYEHGTGHGVGAYLCVHEGPIGINRKSNIELEPGMILSIEPGFYQKHKLGIRLENLVLVKKVTNHPNESFLCFETLTSVPFQRNMLDISMLDKKEKIWLNSYHKSILDKIGPKISSNELKWLTRQCAPITI